MDNNSADFKEAYAKGWEDACVLAILRFRPMTECSFSADEAIFEVQHMLETGAHDPQNRAGYDAGRLLPPDPSIDGIYAVTNGRETFQLRWIAETQTWEGGEGFGLDVATPEGAAMMGLRLDSNAP